MKWVKNRYFQNDFITFTNSLHNSIKFTVGISSSENLLMETTSILEDGKIKLSLHTNDSYLYFKLSSRHPFPTLRGIPKRLTTRIRQICFSVNIVEEQSKKLKSHL